MCICELLTGKTAEFYSLLFLRVSSHLSTFEDDFMKLFWADWPALLTDMLVAVQWSCIWIEQAPLVHNY